MDRSRARRRSLAFASLAAFALSSILALPAAAAVAPVTVAVTPYPNNAAGADPAFVTTGRRVAFDVALVNGSSTTTGVSFSGTAVDAPDEAGDAAYVTHYETGGSLAAQTECAGSGAGFSCVVGNIPAGGTLNLRVVFDTPVLAASETSRLLTFTVVGSGNGSTGSDQPGQSRGDTFTANGSVQVVQLFANDLGRRGVAAFINTPQQSVWASDASGFGPSNPTLTEVTIPAFAAGEIPVGTSIWFTELNATTPCPGASCFGQAVELHYFDGQRAPRPFRVVLTQDNVKSVVSNPSKWTIYHTLDNGMLERPFDRSCTIVNGLPTNAPCGVSRSASSADRTDFIAVFWLAENGFIRGG